MRGEWSDSAVVLAVGRFRETDMWVRLLTRRHGVVRAFAFGASRSRRRFSGCLDLLNILNVRAVLSRNGKFLNLEEGVLLEGPRRLRTDLPRLGMAMNCIRFLEAMDAPVEYGTDDARSGAAEPRAHGNARPELHDPAESGSVEDTFTLMRSLWTRLENGEIAPEVLPVLFRLRLATDQGFAPPFSLCAACGDTLTGQGGCFSVADGAPLCRACAFENRRAVPVSAAALDALAHVQATWPEDWTPESLAPAVRRECARLVDAFVEYHMGISWDRGRFRRM